MTTYLIVVEKWYPVLWYLFWSSFLMLSSPDWVLKALQARACLKHNKLNLKEWELLLKAHSPRHNIATDMMTSISMMMGHTRPLASSISGGGGYCFFAHYFPLFFALGIPFTPLGWWQAPERPSPLGVALSVQFSSLWLSWPSHSVPGSSLTKMMWGGGGSLLISLYWNCFHFIFWAFLGWYPSVTPSPRFPFIFEATEPRNGKTPTMKD